ncbi:MAG TPA: hypothetical protein VNZ01_04755 [Solirubrobacteraceae bacterium]|nr:hypothetical protein [Solirubrobacteraceae bacterium]
MTDPIDPRFLTADPFGTSSFWIQPWRAYLDTWPASKLLDSLGINFNVNRADLEPTAQLLQDSGFKLARIPINWSNLSYEHPTEFPAYAVSQITARLSALHKHGLRPLIVLEAYSGAPTPMQHVNLETVTEAPAGSQTVQLTAASAALVVPGRTGFNGLTWRGSPDILITALSPSGVATLSYALPNALPAGRHGGTVLRYAPFAAPKLAGGEPNPAFQETLSGWLGYVGAAAKLAASVVGPDGFDLEVWNELTFESEFLNSENYLTANPYRRPAATTVSLAQSGAEGPAGERNATSARASSESEGPAEGEPSSEPSAGSETDYGSEAATDQEVEEGPEEGGAEATDAEGAAPAAKFERWHKAVVTKEVIRTLLRETVAYVRNPANGISPAVGITDGFASQTPFPSGAAAPLGLTALSKHPYVGPIDFPAGYPETHAVPLDALGARDTAPHSFQPLFIPTYQSLLPEYTLTASSPETLIRDLAPFTTYVYGFPHGRNVGPPGGNPVQKWITEYNLAPGKAPVMGPDEATPQTGPAATLSSADKSHFHAKALLRSLTAMVNKGMTREYFFAAAPGSLSLIDSRFFSALEAQPGSYPGDQLGGETMDGFRNLLAHFEGPGPTGAARQLKLISISQQEGDHSQLAGDGSAAHPNLYDHSALAVLPFQSSPSHFVIPVYVMTRDLLTLYDPGASPTDISRFDLPDETFRITLGNLPETATAPSVSAYDPLRNQDTPARLLTREGETATFEVAATDYPRLLNVEYTG